MKTLILSLAINILFAGCEGRPTTKPYEPTVPPMNSYSAIVADMEHLMMKRADGADPLRYSIKSSGGVILDTTSYQPKLAPQFAGKECNSIQLVIANDRQYSAEFDPTKTQHVLDSKTLKPNHGSKPFSGIHAGDECVIAVGHMRQEDGQPAAFSVAWVSMANAESSR